MTIDYSDKFGYSPDLPEDIREIFMWLCQDVVYTQRLWDFYNNLFSNEDFDEVFHLATGSFILIEEAIRNDMVMVISRLSDPLKSSGKENLSFQSINQKCNSIGGVNGLINDFIFACGPIRQIRSKKVAHNDLNTRIDPINNPLPGIEKDIIDEILRLAEKILNTIIGNYASVEMSFKSFGLGGAHDLIFWLKLGNQYQEEHDKRLT